MLEFEGERILSPCCGLSLHLLLEFFSEVVAAPSVVIVVGFCFVVARPLLYYPSRLPLRTVGLLSRLPFEDCSVVVRLPLRTVWSGSPFVDCCGAAHGAAPLVTVGAALLFCCGCSPFLFCCGVTVVLFRP
jgi:hypothetical protein